MKGAYSGICFPFSSTMTVFHEVWFGDGNLRRSFSVRKDHPFAYFHQIETYPRLGLSREPWSRSDLIEVSRSFPLFTTIRQ